MESDRVSHANNWEKSISGSRSKNAIITAMDFSTCVLSLLNYNVLEAEVTS